MALNEHTRITVPLARDEFEALRNQAIADYRHPRDQARYILRQALGLDSRVEKMNSTDLVLADDGAVTVINP